MKTENTTMIHVSFENLVMGEMYSKNKTEISVKDVKEKAKKVDKKLKIYGVRRSIDFGKFFYNDFKNNTQMFECVKDKIILKKEFRLYDIGKYLFENLGATCLWSVIDLKEKDEIKIAKKITVWFMSHFFI